MQGSSSGRDRRSRSRSRTPQQQAAPEDQWLPRAGIELQLLVQNQALERAARLFRELRSEIEQLQAQLADLQTLLRSESDWLARLTRRVAALELQVTGRAGTAPITPRAAPASSEQDWRGPDR